MRKHDKLEFYVMKNSRKLFGEEFNLKPDTEQKFDLRGTDAKGLTVIVELKAKTKRNPSDDLHEVVGQILHYAIKYMKSEKKSMDLKDHPKHLRLFIVQEKSKEEYQKALEDICKFLCIHGINIKPIFVESNYTD